MGRVLKRVHVDELKEKLPEILNLELDIVLEDNNVIHGYILSHTAEYIVFRNMVRNKSKIAIRSIKEVLFV